MLGEALTALASMGGTALVTAMVTDGWESLRERLARLLGRGDAKVEAAELERLDEARAALASAGENAELIRRELTVAWKARLEDFLEREPGAADELRALVADAQVANAAGGVQVNAAAYDQAQQAVQGQGTMTVTFGGRLGSSDRE
jgi:hypothetical protein